MICHYSMIWLCKNPIWNVPFHSRLPVILLPAAGGQQKTLIPSPPLLQGDHTVPWCWGADLILSADKSLRGQQRNKTFHKQNLLQHPPLVFSLLQMRNWGQHCFPATFQGAMRLDLMSQISCIQIKMILIKQSRLKWCIQMDECEMFNMYLTIWECGATRLAFQRFCAPKSLKKEKKERLSKMTWCWSQICHRIKVGTFAPIAVSTF